MLYVFFNLPTKLITHTHNFYAAPDTPHKSNFLWIQLLLRLLRIYSCCKCFTTTVAHSFCDAILFYIVVAPTQISFDFRFAVRFAHKTQHNTTAKPHTNNGERSRHTKKYLRSALGNALLHYHA